MANGRPKPAWAAGKGYVNMEKEAAEDAARRRSGPLRFWMKPHTETQICMVDDDPLRFMEHDIKIRGKWGNQATCPGDGCPLCAAGDNPYYVAVWTIVDMTQFVDKQGKQRQNEVRLFAAKQKVMTKLARKSQKLIDGGYPNGLAGIVLSVARDSDKAPGTGDDFDIVGQADPSLLVAPDGKPIVPFEYEKIFEPNMEKLEYYAKIVSGAGVAAPPARF